MKKIAVLVASALILGGLGTKTFAADVNTQNTQAVGEVVSYKEEAGITPDSLLYTIDKAVDELRLFLANTEEKEAAVIADIAEERLGESEVMTEEGKIELAQKALEEYNQKITEAAAKLQEVVVNLEATSEENMDEKLEQSIAELEKAIQEAQQKSLEVLDILKDVIGEEDSEAIEEVVEEQTAHKEAVENFVKERHEFNAAKKSLNMAKVDLKKIEKAGDEEAVKAAQDKLTTAQNEYMAAQTELHAAFQAKKAADSKEPVQAPTEETTPTEVEAPKPVEYKKTNNGNGNGNNSAKTEKEKTSPEKTIKDNGKSGEGNGKKK